MSKSTKIIDQPLGAREIIFAARLKELMEETGIELAIATIDATLRKKPSVVGDEVKPAKKKVAKEKK